MTCFAPRERWARVDRGNMAITMAGNRTPEAAIDAAERWFSVSRCTAKLIERDTPPDTGEVRSEVNSLVDAISACRESVES
jgi:hypothetical protein